MKLSDIEIGTIVNFLNEGGYVLDFLASISLERDKTNRR